MVHPNLKVRVKRGTDGDLLLRRGHMVIAIPDEQAYEIADKIVDLIEQKVAQ